jgi:hypothetical protein
VTARSRAALALHRVHGKPEQIRPDVVDEDGTAVVRVYRVRDRAAALAFVDAERTGRGATRPAPSCASRSDGA